jgi:hypothetical protein
VRSPLCSHQVPSRQAQIKAALLIGALTTPLLANAASQTSSQLMPSFLRVSAVEKV